MNDVRIEKDSMGEMPVPKEALYGASTQRAVLNFPISGHRLPERFIRSLGLLKAICAQVNEELGLLEPTKSKAIQIAGEAIYKGELLEQFPLDVFQTGSGTSSNMNINEVIANYVSQQASSADWF